MFWGLIIEPKKRYTQTVEKAFHLSMAALDATTAGDSPVQIMLFYEGRNYLLCSLQKDSVLQTSLDLNFQEGTKVSFMSNGEGHVHLTGYLIPENDDLEFDDDDEEEEEEEEDVPMLVGQKKRKASDSPKDSVKKIKKQTKEEEEDNESSDEDESALNLLNVTGDLDSDEDDESFQVGEEDSDDDEDDDDLDDDDEDDEEEESDDSDEEVKEEEPKPAVLTKKQKKDKEKHKNMNGKASSQEKEQVKPLNGHVVDSEKKQKKNKEDKKLSNKPEQQQNQVQKKKIEGGVQIEDLVVGNGALAKPGKFATVYYVGKLKNGKKFDQTKSGDGFKFRLGKGEVIKGWDLGVVGMKVGGKRRISIPPAMGYGNKGSPPVIPPNSFLTFEVELRNVN